jgi:hypothetical protein
MASTWDVIIAPVMLPNSVAAQYTASTITVIKAFTAYNSDTSTRVITLYLVSSGGTPTATTTLLYQIPVLAHETIIVWQALDHTLAIGDSIQAFADAASKVSIRVSGVKQ